MIRGETRTEIWKGLDRLKPLDRDTLVAFYIKGRSLKQMSREFETPVGTIKRRLHVARNRLRRPGEEPGRQRASQEKGPRQRVTRRIRQSQGPRQFVAVGLSLLVHRESSPTMSAAIGGGSFMK